MSKRGGRDDIQDTKSSSKLQNLDKKLKKLDSGGVDNQIKITKKLNN